MFQGSWKLSLRTGFKNFRRHYDEKPEDEEVTGTEPPPKRLKLYNGEEPDIGEDEYEAAVEELQEEYKIKQQGKKGKGHGNIKRLMEISGFTITNHSFQKYWRSSRTYQPTDGY